MSFRSLPYHLETTDSPALVMSTLTGKTRALVAQIESLGWATSVHHISGVVEMHAVLKADPDQQRIARVIDGDSEVETHTCACLLAESVGIGIDNC